jgi:hypothetical protein
MGNTDSDSESKLEDQIMEFKETATATRQNLTPSLYILRKTSFTQPTPWVEVRRTNPLHYLPLLFAIGCRELAEMVFHAGFLVHCSERNASESCRLPSYILYKQPDIIAVSQGHSLSASDTCAR